MEEELLAASWLLLFALSICFIVLGPGGVASRLASTAVVVGGALGLCALLFAGVELVSEATCGELLDALGRRPSRSWLSFHCLALWLSATVVVGALACVGLAVRWWSLSRASRQPRAPGA